MTKDELIAEIDIHTLAIFNLRETLPSELAQYSRLLSEIIITHEDVRKSIHEDLL